MEKKEVEFQYTSFNIALVAALSLEITVYILQVESKQLNSTLLRIWPLSYIYSGHCTVVLP